jgi:hypothetical protein
MNGTVPSTTSVSCHEYTNAMMTPAARPHTTNVTIAVHVPRFSDANKQTCHYAHIVHDLQTKVGTGGRMHHRDVRRQLRCKRAHVVLLQSHAHRHHHSRNGSVAVIDSDPRLWL